MPGDAANTVLPWQQQEQLPVFTGHHRNQSLARWASTPLKRCAIIVDRHVHKNGGSSVRDLFLENERLGHGLYQGYTQMYWNHDYRLIRRAAERSLSQGVAPEQLLMIEAHFGWVEMSNVVLPSLLELSALYKKYGVDCPLVLMTRVGPPNDCIPCHVSRHGLLPWCLPLCIEM